MTARYMNLSPSNSFTEPAPPPRSSEGEITAALEEYFALLEDGREPERAEFLARHPEIADSLAECLDGLEFVNRAAGEFTPGPLLAGPVVESPPSQVLGDYRLIREIGRGGMGVVYEAEQVSLGRRVALKVLPSAAALDPRHRQRFQVEVQAVALLRHDHIVPIFGVGCDQGAHYFAMQLIDGPSLTQIIQDLKHEQTPETSPVDELSRGLESSGSRLFHIKSRLSRSAVHSSTIRERCRTAARLGLEAAEALEHAHQLGVIHRDVKPSNLLVDAQGKLWVADFGLARLPEHEHDLTWTGDLIGTVRYMSPEQVRAQRGGVGWATDIYSLGVTLYELITLQPAFFSQDRQELLRRILHDDPVSPRKLHPAIPRDLETIVLKAMEKEPTARYGSARAMADDLKRFLGDEPILARRAGMVERTIKWVRRHRTSVAVSTAALILTLMVATVALWQAKRQSDTNLETYRKALLLQRLGVEYALGSFDQITRSRVARRQPGTPLDEDTVQTLAAAVSYYDRLPDMYRGTDIAKEVVAKARRQAGFCRMVLGRSKGRENYRDATSYYKTIAEQSPGQIWVRTGLIETLHEYARFLRAEEDQPEARALLGEALDVADALVDNPEAGKHCYTMALAPAVSSLAWELVRPSRPDPADVTRAIRLAGQATAWEPQQPAGWRTLGAAYLRRGDNQAAIRALVKARELDRAEVPLDHLLLAAAYHASGERESARRQFAEAVRLVETSRSRDPDEQVELQGIRDEVELALSK